MAVPRIKNRQNQQDSHLAPLSQAESAHYLLRAGKKSSKLLGCCLYVAEIKQLAVFSEVQLGGVIGVLVGAAA